MLLLAIPAATQTGAAEEATTDSYAQGVVPFLSHYCADCHTGDDAEAGLDFEPYRRESRVQEDFAIWQRITRMVQSHRMPPADAIQPDDSERQAFLAAAQLELQRFDCRQASYRPYVTARRLNRAEYNNTLRDLIGIDSQPAADFPTDDVGYGFDNIAGVLALPPALLEKYLASAQSVIEQAFSDPTALARILVHPIENESDARDVYRRNLFEFAERAFRRPLTEFDRENLEQLTRELFAIGASPGETVKAICASILVSPHFLFRFEQGQTAGSDSSAPTDAPPGMAPIDDWQLASRLSYFLWSSMPDEELFALARRGALHDAEVLRRQVERMLRDEKSAAFADSFASQWLQLRLLAARAPDPNGFPQFNASLGDSMRDETLQFFHDVLRENRSVMEFLTGDHSYLNEALADLYGIPGIVGDALRRVELPPERRGILTQASILLITSNPTRTSPVKRGKWILDNLLGEPPPPPPPAVPELPDSGEALGSLRERMEQHRENPACASCHQQMDALGFGLENFNVVGAWRTEDRGETIDATGTLPGGLSFDGPAQLAQVLAAERRTEFVRCLIEKLMTYALGRGVQLPDQCAIQAIATDVQENDDRLQSIITAIVLSEPFRWGASQSR